MKDTFLLIDGSSLLFRAFFAIRGLRTKDGIYTNGVYGFLMMFFKALEMIEPTHVAVAFDRSAPTFRKKDYEAYKANRQETPSELQAQFGILKDVLHTLGIRTIDMEGYEADDLVGTLVSQSPQLKHVLLTGDRDYFQLIDADTTVLFTKKGISELAIVDEASVEEKYGLTPSQLIDVKGLQGDASDNIPGVPGVGEKTALKLIQAHGSLEGVYAHLDEVKGAKLKKNLEENEALAKMSKRLGTIFRECPIEEPIEHFLRQPIDYEQMFDRFDRLEFGSFKKRFEEVGEAAPRDQKKESALEPAQNLLNLSDWTELEQAETLYMHLWMDGERALRDPLELLIIGAQHSYYLPLQELTDELRQKVQTLLHDAEQSIIFNAKNTMLALWRMGIVWKATPDDPMLIDYLLDPSRSKYTLEGLADRYTSCKLEDEISFRGKGKKRIALASLEEDVLAQRVAQEVQVLKESWKPLQELLHEQNMQALYEQMERPLSYRLAQMEWEGVQTDEHVLDRLEEEFEEQMQTMEQQIYEYAGHAFNINSPKQLGDVLFVDLKLPHGKKTKLGYSTNAETLENIREEHPIVEAVLSYRRLSKLQSTYVRGLRPFIDEDGRIRSSFQQTATSTGRLSSMDPNLQNIPIRTPEGRQLRALIVAKEGYSLVDADYSQIELRILASLAEDETMIHAFLEGEDIHRKTAAEVNHIPLDEVTSLQRSHAKAVNFGIIYGISDFGLSRDLHIPRAEAKEYIERYKNTYPQIKQYMEDIVAQAKADGYVQTHYGRRRLVPELHSRNFNIRGFGERIALNTPIQGTAADVIKLAMLRVCECLEKEGVDAKLVLQVHDELMIEVCDEQAEKVRALVEETMQSVAELAVPLTVDAEVVKSWIEA